MAKHMKLAAAVLMAIAVVLAIAAIVVVTAEPGGVMATPDLLWCFAQEISKCPSGTPLRACDRAATKKCAALAFP